MSELEVNVYNYTPTGVVTGPGLFILPGATGPAGPSGVTGPAQGLIKITKYPVGTGVNIPLHPDTTAFIAKGQGPGGGGAGVDGELSKLAVAGGAGAGDYFEHIFYVTGPSGPTTFDYVVGAGGTGASPGNNDGFEGSDTTRIIYSGTSVIAGLGFGGQGVLAANTDGVQARGRAGGYYPSGMGAPPNLFFRRGSNGENSYVFQNSSPNRSGKSGRGGDSFSGRGGEGYDWPIGYGDGSIPGNPGGPGAGAGGAVAHNTASNVGSAEGGDGNLTVEEYARLSGP